MTDPLRVVNLRPSKYTADGHMERFRWGFMPNRTVPNVRSMTAAGLGGTQNLKGDVEHASLYA